MVDTGVGSAELEALAEALAPPCQVGDYSLEGLIARTSTALVFVARGGAFGAEDGVLKLTGGQYAPLLERELGLLNRCRAAGITGIVQPVQDHLEWFNCPGAAELSAAAILLPFLGGGDLVQWIGVHATRTGELGPELALDAGEHVGRVLRNLLQLASPIVHCDVKPQNVLLPYPDAPLTLLTLIDLDVSEELHIAPDAFASAPRHVLERLAEDVNGFGELLFDLATGSLPPAEGEPNPHTRNAAFNALVVKCLTSEPTAAGYLSLADRALWHDLETAQRVARASGRRRRPDAGWQWQETVRRSLACLGVVLFVGLVVALALKMFVG